MNLHSWARVFPPGCTLSLTLWWDSFAADCPSLVISKVAVCVTEYLATHLQCERSTFSQSLHSGPPPPLPLPLHFDWFHVIFSAVLSSRLLSLPRKSQSRRIVEHHSDLHHQRLSVHLLGVFIASFYFSSLRLSLRCLCRQCCLFPFLSSLCLH